MNTGTKLKMSVYLALLDVEKFTFRHLRSAVNYFHSQQSKIMSETSNSCLSAGDYLSFQAYTLAPAALVPLARFTRSPFTPQPFMHTSGLHNPPAQSSPQPSPQPSAQASPDPQPQPQPSRLSPLTLSDDVLSNCGANCIKCQDVSGQVGPRAHLHGDQTRQLTHSSHLHLHLLTDLA